MLLPNAPTAEREREKDIIATTMETTEDDKAKKLNDDMVLFVRKRSEHEAPRYTARLKTILDIHQKRRKADSARDRKAGLPERSRKKIEESSKDPYVSWPSAKRSKRSSRDSGQRDATCRHRSLSRSNLSLSQDAESDERSVMSYSSSVPSEGCRRRRRKKSCRKKRKRSKCRKKKKRRRRSCPKPCPKPKPKCKKRKRKRSGCKRKKRRC